MATINNSVALIDFINANMKPKEMEKMEFGEVFTPLCLVNEMMDKLEENNISIFNNPTLKWLDPACGIGNFMIVLFYRLMKGLICITDVEERQQHILEQMLYMCEINVDSVVILNRIFCGDKYRLNINLGDTLLMTMTQKYDIIIGNPPFNSGGIHSPGGKKLGEKNETIWTKFVSKSLEWLKPDGYLIFITPLSWLNKSHSLHDELLKRHIIWLKLYNGAQSKKIIHASIPISIYLLKNTINTKNKKTELISEIKRKTYKSLQYLNPKYSIPLAFYSIFNKLLQFIEKHNCNLEYNTKFIKSSGTKAKIPNDYTLEDMWAVDTYRLKDGILVKKTIKQHRDANKRKLIIANKSSFNGAFIDDGKLGLTGRHKFYILGDNLELLLKLLSFKISNIISIFTKYGMSFLDNTAFKYIPDLRKIGIVDITEEDFYKLIGLNDDEIALIVR